MSRTYQYLGFDVEVAVETDFSRKGACGAVTNAGYVAVVRISKASAAVAVFSPPEGSEKRKASRSLARLTHSRVASAQDDVLSMTCSIRDLGC